MRRKLFSEDKRTTTRRRLFSNDEIQVSQIDNSIQEESKAGDNIIPNDPGVSIHFNMMDQIFILYALIVEVIDSN